MGLAHKNILFAPECEKQPVILVRLPCYCL